MILLRFTMVLSILCALLGSAVTASASGQCFFGLGDEEAGVGIGPDVGWGGDDGPKFWCNTDTSCDGLFVEIHKGGADGGHCNEFSSDA